MKRAIRMDREGCEDTYSVLLLEIELHVLHLQGEERMQDSSRWIRSGSGGGGDPVASPESTRPLSQKRKNSECTAMVDVTCFL